MLRYTLKPAIDEPVSFHVKLTVCVTTATPVPVSAIAAGEPVALLVTVMLPFAAPAAPGSKITLNVNACEGFRVTAPAPLSEYPVPLTEIAEICTALLPVLVIVSVNVEGEDVFTLPNARLDELSDSVLVAATPVPLRATVVGEFGALLAILTVPDRLPVVVGANTALNETLDPGATVLGTVSPFTE